MRSNRHRCSQSTGITAKNSEPVNRKERAQFNALIRPLEEAALYTWAAEAQIFTSEENFLSQHESDKIGEGAEQQVYLQTSGISVLKTNDAIMHGNWLEFFDRLTMHNWLFPETAYTLHGLTEVKGSLAAIIEQPFLRCNTGAIREEVTEDLWQRGFERIRNDDYYSPTLGIILEDLHEENVLRMDSGLLLYFNPIIYLETPEMNKAGNFVYRFPFG